MPLKVTTRAAAFAVIGRPRERARPDSVCQYAAWKKPETARYGTFGQTKLDDRQT
jgi:hypothetical protein